MAISFDPESKSYSDGVTTLEIKDGVYEIDSLPSHTSLKLSFLSSCLSLR